MQHSARVLTPSPLRRAVIACVRTKAGSLLLAAGAAALCGMFVHQHGYVLLCGILAALLLGMLWPWLSLRPLSAALTFEESRGREGEPLRVHLAIRNRWLLPVWGVSVDGMAEEPTAAGLFLMNVPAGRSAALSWEFTPPCRGEYPRIPLHLVCGFPFGLWHSRKPIRVDRPVCVWPRTVPVGPLYDTGGQWDEEGAAARTRAGSGGEFLGVRPYRRGDRLRLVHWGQTARQDRLIVREVQETVRPRVRIVIDTDLVAYDDLSPDGPREWAIRIAASLFVGWLDQGAKVGMVIGHRSFPITSSSSGYRRLVLDALARIPDAEGQPLCDTTRRTLRHAGDSLLVVIASGRSSPSWHLGDLPTGETRLIVVPPQWRRGRPETPSEHHLRSRSWITLDNADEVETRLQLL